jgi:1-acyl-sn-glycerol-3-phosphate acyltransferase
MENIKANNKSGSVKEVLLNIFARIWALWGLISFVATFLIIFLPSMLAYFIKDPKGQAYFIKVSKIWMTFWLPLIGCPVRVTGKENFIAGKTYVVIFNHNALLDVPLSAPYVPGPNKTIAKASFVKVPIFGLFYKKGSVLVDRKDEKSRVKSYEAMKKVLATGMHMCIYPEGTRNRTSEPLKPFYDGAFKLAAEAGKDIIPCVITGTKKAMPVHKPFYLLPTPLKMHFLPALAAGNIAAKDLKEQAFTVMKEYYVKNN